MAITPPTAQADSGLTRVVVEHNNALTRVFANEADCQTYGYSFTYTESYDVRRSIIDYYDASGTLVREVADVHATGVATNDTTGGSIPVSSERHIVMDFIAGTWTESGVLRHVTDPGQGIVLHESGRIVTDLDTQSNIFFEAGPHQFSTGDLAGFCAALATA
jgi:hypothetical protein